MMRLLHILKKTTVQLAGLSALAAWVLWKAERDYAQKGRLSAGASTSGWVLYLTHLGLTVVSSLGSSRRLLPVNRKTATVLGVPVSVCGSLLFAAGVREFRSFEQMSGVETGNLVKSGPYRYSRNPQVAGWGIALFGIAIAGWSVKALVLLGVFFFVHRLYFSIEERHLEKIFGEEYRRYRIETPRFLGLPKTD